MYNVIGTNNPEYLLADPVGAEVIAISMEPGNGIISRGTIVYLKANGMYAPAAAAQADGTKYLAVLDETVNTSADMAVGDVARAYRAGRLIAGKVTLESGADVTAAVALILRKQGITLDHMDILAPDHDNFKYTITYKANSGTGADVLAYADIGAAYTIADNTFTPPAGKQFDKWNTKADGQGTDYAAAATYTANADLTLYAIWKD